MYEIQFTTGAQKYFKKLRDKKLKNIFYEALHKISENPYIGAQKSGDLATVYGYACVFNFRNRRENDYYSFGRDKRKFL